MPATRHALSKVGDMQPQPVSVIIDRNVVSGKQAEFEVLLEGITEAASRRKGYLGAKVTKPKSEGGHHYQIVFGFDSQEHLDIWIQSEDRKKWVEQIDSILQEPTHVHFVTGLETWFCLPGTTTMTPPPRYKMAVVTWIAITPLLTAFNYFLGPALSDLPLALRLACTSPMIVLIMTYGVMPLMTKLFRGWLFPNTRNA